MTLRTTLRQTIKSDDFTPTFLSWYCRKNDSSLSCNPLLWSLLSQTTLREIIRHLPPPCQNRSCVRVLDQCLFLHRPLYSSYKLIYLWRLCQETTFNAWKRHTARVKNEFWKVVGVHLSEWFIPSELSQSVALADRTHRSHEVWKSNNWNLHIHMVLYFLFMCWTNRHQASSLCYY